MSEKIHYAAVVGAGPAGMFAAREMARSGVKVVLFNRDIKPGGLAEYGIYPDKFVMKESLRVQFRQVLDTPGITYLGNITVGSQDDLSLDDLRALGFQAILVTAGAQGTKWLRLPGENLTGVYQAKYLVYHYNLLPRYTLKMFHFGKKVAIVGAGNVMIDVARFVIQKVKAEEVIVVVRRGPAEIKFDKKEMENIICNLDQHAFDEEISRVSPQMVAIGQDPLEAKAQILGALPKALPTKSPTRFRFEFLASPAQMLGGDDGIVNGLEVEDNDLVLQDGEVKPKGTGHKRTIQVDSVIFAIGDKVDESFGLPTQWNEFSKSPQPRFPVNDISYEAYNPTANTLIEDVFVAGWSRKASSGLVGYARKDGINGAKAVLQYLQTLPPTEPDEAALAARLEKLPQPFVTLSDVRSLVAIETEIARQRGLEFFKFGTNEEMLEKIMAARSA
ncbi:MAG: FAD-dependent oxidoreductase [Anaerolineales bacterium]